LTAYPRLGYASAMPSEDRNRRATTRVRASKLEASDSAPTVDYLILGDFAQVINRRLYLMGGGWTQFSPPAYPAMMRLGIAVGIRVPWLEANVPHQLTLLVQDEDKHVEVIRLEAEFETGRPPGSRGEDQLVPLALNGQARLDGTGDFVITASIDGQERKRYAFKARDRRAM
jgi:hypothetical protein